MTLQDFQQQALALLHELSPPTIVYSSLKVGCSLDEKGIGEASMHLYLSNGDFTSPLVNQTYKAPSFQKLLGRLARELEDLFQPEELEIITL